MKTIRIYVTLEELFGEGGFDATSVQNAVNELAQSKQTFDAKFANVINILADEYYDWYAGYVDKWFLPGVAVHLDEDDYAKIGTRFSRNLMVIYNFTKDKYLGLLKLYEDNKNKLLDKLENVTSSNSSHRVNDTPQDAGTGHSNFEDDDHTSLWEGTDNTTTVTNDPMTIMARIDEIQNRYMNVLRAWCREFNSLFIAPTEQEFYVDLDEGE